MMQRHELDPISLTAGFAFTGLGLLFLINQADQALRLRWVWPLLLLALGAGILLDVIRGGRRSPDPAPDPDPAGAEPGPEVDQDEAAAELGPDPAGPDRPR